MNQKGISYFVVLALLLLTGALTIQAVWFQRTQDSNQKHFSERVNLALRQTAHQLLALEGDRTSRIKPVKQLDAVTWLIPIERNFNYDSLPPLLHRAFSFQNITADYNVLVLDCKKKELMLGYNAYNYLSGKEVPCGGRERVAGCYELTVSFLQDEKSWLSKSNFWVFSIVFVIIVLLYNFLKNKKLKEDLNPALFIQPSFDAEILLLPFGQCALDAANQILFVNNIKKDLTYRETKLLQLFCNHRNQLLERDAILKAVWEDEGIIVGRSVDVFVSRLRKLLKEDETVKIVNVHGVGYRLDVE